MQFAQRLNKVETSAIRELFKLLGKPGIISFAGGFPDSAMFDVEGIRMASEQALRDEPGAALQYGATEGYNPLREQLAAFMQSKGVVGLRADELIVTTGSQQALDLVGKTLLDPQDTVLVESPTFLATIQCFRLYGPTVLGVPVDAEGVDVDALEAMVKQHRPKLIYLVPTFGNPSGALTSLQRRLRILNLAVQYQTVVLALSAQVPGSRDWLVHCGSLSKVLSPGLRIGWMVAPPELLARATMCKQFSDAHTSTFAQATAAKYLQADRMPATLQNVRRVYASRARAMAQALHQHLGEGLSFHAPQGGLFVWAQLTGQTGHTTDGRLLAQRAIDKGVAFVPGAPFFANDPDNSTIRLSFATADEHKIAEGIERLGAALRETHSTH
jgi:DNA-binding transcriptional MocR family regulator